jgi:hypothetical protein
MSALIELIVKNPQSVGIVVLCMLAVAAFVTEQVMPGRSYVRACAERDVQIERLTKERDEFKTALFQALTVAEQSQKTRQQVFGAG